MVHKKNFSKIKIPLSLALSPASGEEGIRLCVLCVLCVLIFTVPHKTFAAEPPVPARKTETLDTVKQRLRQEETRKDTLARQVENLEKELSSCDSSL
jgi:hypothetical protein